jgi:hypothetical protein
LLNLGQVDRIVARAPSRQGIQAIQCAGIRGMHRGATTRYQEHGYHRAPYRDVPPIHRANAPPGVRRPVRSRDVPEGDAPIGIPANVRLPDRVKQEAESGSFRASVDTAWALCADIREGHRADEVLTFEH